MVALDHRETDPGVQDRAHLRQTATWRFRARRGVLEALIHASILLACYYRTAEIGVGQVSVATRATATEHLESQC